MNWYNRISKDISIIPDAIEYYEKELINAKSEIKIKGYIESAAAEMPGIITHRFNQLQEIEAILEFLNLELKKTKSFYFKKYLENYQRALSSREVEKYVDGEKAVNDYELLINEFALIRNKWLGVMKGLEAKGFSINNLIKLRVAGLDDLSY